MCRLHWGAQTENSERKKKQFKNNIVKKNPSEQKSRHSKPCSDGGLENWSRLDGSLVSSLKGLGLVSVSRFKGIGLARDYSIETTRPEEKTNENRGMKKALCRR